MTSKFRQHSLTRREAALPEPGARRRWPLPLLVAAAILLLTILFASQALAARLVAGREADWAGVLVHYLVLWTLWAAVAPLVFLAARNIRAEVSPLRLLLHVPAGALICSLHIFLFVIVMWRVRGEGWLPPVGELRTAVVSSLGLAFTIYLALVGGYHAVRYYRAFREREVASLRLETQLAQARLETLRGQLQPHFLFNTLHAISALMEEDVPAARRMMARLSTLLRFSLDQDPGREIPLEKELELLRIYLEIQQTRFGDRLGVQWEVEPDVSACPVPYLILQPLVENAIQHGLEPRPGPGRLEIAAAVRDGRLRLSVRDDGVGLENRGPREGIGLANTRDRLQNLYGTEASLRLRDREGGGTEVAVEIPVRRDPPGRTRSTIHQAERS